MAINIKINLLTLFITFTLSSCAQISTIKTNLDKENFQHYFSPTQVAIYNDESAFKGTFNYIGMVEGDDCQTKNHLAVPDIILARSKARRSAFKAGANAIVFTGCAEIKTNHCIAQVVCYGKAYRVEQ